MSNNTNTKKTQEVITREEQTLKTSLPYLVLVSFIVGVGLGGFLTGVVDIFNSDKDGSEDNTVEIDRDLPDGEYYNESYVNSILDVLRSKYIGDLPEGEEVDYELIKGYINALDDPYTTFLTPEEAESYLDQRTSEFEGVGITLGYDGTYTYVETVLKGHPAEAAGMLPRDIILEVDGSSVEGKMPAEVAELIRGEKDTKVLIKVARAIDESYDEKEFEIVRKEIQIDNILWKEVEDGIVEIDITQFSDESVQQFNDSWDKVVNEIQDEVGTPEGIIVDLRNNPGGFVLSVRYVMEEFLSEGTILMQEEDRDGDITKFEDDREGEFEDIPLVVLVNEGSASASEIFASAIQDNGRGTIVGQATVGKGVEQEIVTLEDGSMLIVVFQKWLTSNGDEISQEEPIQPDIKVEYETEDYENGEDPQLDEALEVLVD